MNTIKFTSRASVKIKESFYTFEACIEKTVPEDCDYEEFKKQLWDEANAEVDNQIAETYNFIMQK